MSQSNNLKMAGKILYAVPFIVFGILHLSKGAAMAGLVPSYIPGGAFWVYVTGAVFILAALAILTGKWAFQGAIALAVQLLVFVALIHIPGTLAGNQSSLGGLLKDLALAGGALVIASFCSTGGECKGGSCTGSAGSAKM